MLTKDQQIAIGRNLEKPYLYGIYKHIKSGELYQVYDITNDHSEDISKPVMVSYKRLSDGTKWSQSLIDWVGKFSRYTG